MDAKQLFLLKNIEITAIKPEPSQLLDDSDYFKTSSAMAHKSVESNLFWLFYIIDPIVEVRSDLLKDME